MKNKFDELPEKWYIIITEENREVLENYRSKLPKRPSWECNWGCLDSEALGTALISDNAYSQYMYWGRANLKKSLKEQNYQEISYETFKYYFVPNNEPESYDYLTPILKAHNII